QERGSGLGHVLALGREVETGQAAVENSAGIADLAVAKQVNHRGVGHGALSLLDLQTALAQVPVGACAAAAAARAAAGSASALRPSASSSCAAQTNHAS